MLRADLRPPLTDAMEEALVAAASIAPHHDVLIPCGVAGGLRHKLVWLARSVVAIDGDGDEAVIKSMPWELPNVKTYHVDFLTDWSRNVATGGRLFERIVMVAPINHLLQSRFIATALECLAPGGIMVTTATQAGINGVGSLRPFTSVPLFEDVGLVRFG